MTVGRYRSRKVHNVGALARESVADLEGFLCDGAAECFHQVTGADDTRSLAAPEAVLDSVRRNGQDVRHEQ